MQLQYLSSYVIELVIGSTNRTCMLIFEAQQIVIVYTEHQTQETDG